jgi:hypothetical protein
MNNQFQAHRHAYRAWEDFCDLRERLSLTSYGEELLHSISHHLRHAVYRTGKELPHKQRHYVRRRFDKK